LSGFDQLLRAFWIGANNGIGSDGGELRLLRDGRSAQQHRKDKRGTLAERRSGHEWLSRGTIILLEEAGGSVGLTLAWRAA